jgi:predicted kinase
MRATLFLIVGLPGSGKTTLARQLEREHRAMRFTPDEWMRPLFGADVSGHSLRDARTPVETIMWSIASRALELGVNVILDFGFWSRAERIEFRTRASNLGARSEIRFCSVSRDELWRRIDARNARLSPHDFHITQEQLDDWWRRFEPPAAAELSMD